MDGFGIHTRDKTWRVKHLSGHNMVSTTDPTGEVLRSRGKMRTVCVEKEHCKMQKNNHEIRKGERFLTGRLKDGVFKDEERKTT